MPTPSRCNIITIRSIIEFGYVGIRVKVEYNPSPDKLYDHYRSIEVSKYVIISEHENRHIKSRLLPIELNPNINPSKHDFFGHCYELLH
jgi:hypothetical protein